MTVDDSALIHRRAYDPVKAREYYLKTRQLKGRRSGSSKEDSTSSSTVGSKVVTSNTEMRPSRQAELEAQRDALMKRLETLRNVLAQKVEAAKARSGVETPSKKEAASEQTKEKSGKETADKPLTEQQKREKREASREQYEKERKMSLSVEVQQLQEQIKDIRAKIEKAIADARQRSLQSTIQTASKGR